MVLMKHLWNNILSLFSFFSMTVFRRLKFGFIAIAVVTVALFLFGMFFSLEKANVTVPTSSSLIFYTEQNHPAVLLFSERYDTPAISQVDPWFATVIDSIQSSYRAYGIRSGLLESSVFVEFSKSILKSAVVQMNVTKDLGSLTALDFAELFRTNHSLVKLLAPQALEEHVNVSNIQEVEKSNPMNVEVVEMGWATTLNDMKQIMTEAEQPLLLTIPQPLAQYNVSGEVVSFEAMLPNGQFFNPASPAVLVAGRPMTMLLYGWNDDISTYLQDVSSNKSYGGMIVKLPRGAKGLPIGVYEQTLEVREAESICGSMDVPSEWGGDIVLRCKDAKYCDTGCTYSMYTISWEGGQSHVVESMPDGTSNTKMWRIEGETKKLVTISGVPYHLLGNVFEPVHEKGKGDEHACNFWFLPYDLLERLIRLSTPQNYPIVISTAWKWSRDSYQKKVESIIKSMQPMSQRVTSVFP